MAKKKSNQSKKNLAQKEIKKATEKAAKKHPVAFIVVSLVVVAAIAVGGYFAYKNNLFGSSSNSSASSSSSSLNESSSNGNSQRSSSDGSTDSISFHFLTLGNGNSGDSIYIKAGDNDILIDAGSKSGSATYICNALKEYVTDGKLEYVITTHAHSDHYTGMFGNKDSSASNGYTGVLYQYKVGQIIDFAYMAKATTESSGKTVLVHNDSNLTADKFSSTSEPYKYITARNFAVSQGAKWNPIDTLTKKGSNYSISLGNNLSMEFLYQGYYDTGNKSTENNNSVVTLFHQGDSEFLFTGDLEEDGVESLLENNPSLGHVKLFKAGHHGSINANPDSLYQKITPETVVISASCGVSEYTVDGDNVMPYQSTIDIIAKYTTNVFATTYGDFSGTKGKINDYGDLNGRVNLTYTEDKAYVYNGNNDTILKDSAWFNKTNDIYASSDSTKPNRTWPSVTSKYTTPLIYSNPN